MLPLNFRVVLAICTLITLVIVWSIFMNSKDKQDYNHVSGKINYMNKVLGELPNRDLGKYRYLPVVGVITNQFH